VLLDEFIAADGDAEKDALHAEFGDVGSKTPYFDNLVNGQQEPLADAWLTDASEKQYRLSGVSPEWLVPSRAYETSSGKGTPPIPSSDGNRHYLSDEPSRRGVETSRTTYLWPMTDVDELTHWTKERSANHADLAPVTLTPTPAPAPLGRPTRHVRKRRNREHEAIRDDSLRGNKRARSLLSWIQVRLGGREPNGADKGIASMVRTLVIAPQHTAHDNRMVLGEFELAHVLSAVGWLGAGKRAESFISSWQVVPSTCIPAQGRRRSLRGSQVKFRCLDIEP
jgi:hypothetical protein